MDVLLKIDKKIHKIGLEALRKKARQLKCVLEGVRGF